MISYEEALSKIKTLPLSLQEEQVSPLNAFGRVLSRSVTTPFPMPRFDNSAMDGYAVRAEDLQSPGTSLTLAGESAAGRPYGRLLEKGTCVKISTGAEIPSGTDCIVPVEQAQSSDQSVTFSIAAEKDRHIRYTGSDFEAGNVVLEKGTRIDASKLAVLAMYNLQAVSVFKKPKIAVFTSGDEIKQWGEELGPTQIVGSNIYYLERDLTDFGCDVRQFGVVSDDPEDFKGTMSEALEWSDAVVTTAGVSVGEHDVVGAAVRELGGEILFWKVAVRPGKPMLVVRFGEKPYFGLPGNPVSTICNNEIFVKPFLAEKLGLHFDKRSTLTARLDAPAARDKKRLFFAISVCRLEDGELSVRPFPTQASSNLAHAGQANCMCVIEPGTEPLAVGERVQVVMLPGAREMLF